MAATGVVVSGHFPLLRCGRCGLAFLDLPPEDGGAESFDEYWNDANERVYSNERVLAALGRKYARYLGIARAQAPNPRLLDVGSGVGLFVEKASAMGFDAAGVEPSSRAVAVAARQRRVTVHRGLLGVDDGLPRDNGVLSIWDVIEHVADPEALLKACHAHLAPKGLLILETPDETAMFRGLLRAGTRLSGGLVNLERGIYYRAHRYYFSRAAMRVLLERCGFGDIRFFREYTIFEKSLEKMRQYGGGMSRAKAGLYRLAFASVRRMPFLANKMVVVCAKIPSVPAAGMTRDGSGHMEGAAR